MKCTCGKEMTFIRDLTDEEIKDFDYFTQGDEVVTNVENDLRANMENLELLQTSLKALYEQKVNLVYLREVFFRTLAKSENVPKDRLRVMDGKLYDHGED